MSTRLVDVSICGVLFVWPPHDALFLLVVHVYLPLCVFDEHSAHIAAIKRQLDGVRLALEALQEYHRVQMWSIVHLHYMPKGPEANLIEFKLNHLRRCARAHTCRLLFFSCWGRALMGVLCCAMMDGCVMLTLMLMLCIAWQACR